MPECIYRLLLFAYPRTFRRDKGDEMLDVFRACYAAAREKGRLKEVLTFWLGTAWDAISNGVMMRFDRQSNDVPHHGAGVYETLRYDLRMAARAQLRNPAFSIPAILVLSGGLAAASVLYALVDGILWSPLPYPNGDRIAVIWDRDLKTAGALSLRSAAPANFADWREHSRSFSMMSAVRTARMLLQEGELSEPITAIRASADLLPVLGAKPELGRWFAAEEDVTGNERVAVLSYEVWKRRFGGDPLITQRTILFDAQAYKVVGVMPRSFQFPPPMRLQRGSALVPGDIWIPLGQQTTSSPRDSRNLRVFALLAPGVTVRAADAEANVIAERLRTQYPATNLDSAARVISLREQMVAPVRPTLWMLMVGVGLLLLLTSSNLSGLLLSRIVARSREMSTRIALGASRRRLVCQVIAENVLLALFSGALGLNLARAILAALPVLLPPDFPRLSDVHLNLTTVLFTLAVSIAAGALFGFAPAFLVSRSDTRAALAENSRSAAGSRRQTWLRSTMVSAQVAIALTLLIGSGLLTRTLLRLQSVDIGFDVKDLLVMQLSVPRSLYPSRESLSLFYRQVEQQVRSLPGVREAATTVNVPFGDSRSGWNIEVEGKPAAPNQPLPIAGYHNISPAYLAGMAIALRQGRNFSSTETPSTPLAGIVSQSFAREHWPNGDVVGKRFRLGDSDGPYPWITVIGIVGPVHHGALDLSPGTDIYLCDCQQPVRAVYLVVRTIGSRPELASTIADRVTTLSKSVAVYGATNMPTMVKESLVERRLAALLLGGFAVAALLLSTLGLYAVLNYLIAQRTREIGIRIAVGASKLDIVRNVAGQGLRMAILGLTAGFALAAGAVRFLQSFLYQSTPYDPLVFGLAPALLLVFVLLAILVPAARAARLDPIKALRSE